MRPMRAHFVKAGSASTRLRHNARMNALARLGHRLREDRLLLALLAALVPLVLLARPEAGALAALVDWHTIAALGGLMVLSRGLEDSGYLARAGVALVSRVRGERTLAVALVLFSALLSAVVTNDVALFIVVPLTLSLASVATLPIGRLIVFEALAVNAGSAASPVGNPQNLFLWQSSGSGFVEFTLAMLPLGAALLTLLLVLIPLAFRARRIERRDAAWGTLTHGRLFACSLALYVPFLVATELGHAPLAAVLITLGYAALARHVVHSVDWMLLVVFMLMFIDLGLLAGLPPIAHNADLLLALPGDALTAGAVLSQFISNVPAAIFLERFTDDWRTLAWGVSVGGFGLAIGSLANLIALRLAREAGLWRDFHRWSLPLFGLGLGVAFLLR